MVGLRLYLRFLGQSRRGAQLGAYFERSARKISLPCPSLVLQSAMSFIRYLPPMKPAVAQTKVPV